MSRHDAAQISLRSWRGALAALFIVTSTVLGATLLVAQQGHTLDTRLAADRLDAKWEIQSGHKESDRLMLNPAAGSIGLALHSVESMAFTLQARVVSNQPRGSSGLIVRADSAEHFTAFMISGDGYFRVSDYRNGAWIDRAAWRAWPHIRRDGAANVLRAECQPDVCNFFVNDEWTWQEKALPAVRWIGLLAESQRGSEAFTASFDQIMRRP
jgi:hypothetical protein